MRSAIVPAMLMAGILAGACQNRTQTKRAEGAACPPLGEGWRKGPIEPPIRVMVFRVAAGTRLTLDGRAVDRRALSDALREARPLRPSPYVILSRDPAFDCASWRRLGSAIDDAFDCKANYCFY